MLPTLHREAGLRFHFTSHDRLESAHVHVVGNGGKAKVWLTPTPRLEEARGYSRRQVERILRIAQAHREAWLTAWRSFFREA